MPDLIDDVSDILEDPKAYHESIIKHQVEVTGRLLNGLRKEFGTGVCALGGAPRNWEKGLSARDVDIFLPYRGDQNEEDPYYSKRLDSVLTKIFGEGVSNIYTHIDSQYAAIFETDLVVVYQFTADGQEFQVILIQEPDDTNFITHLYNNTDIGLNEIIWRGLIHLGKPSFECSPNHLQDKKNKTLTIKNIQLNQQKITQLIFNHLPKMQSYYPDFEVKIPKLPSKVYFEEVKTIENYKSMKATGMAWEVEPNFPGSWKEHEILRTVYQSVFGMLPNDPVPF